MNPELQRELLTAFHDDLPHSDCQRYMTTSSKVSIAAETLSVSRPVIKNFFSFLYMHHEREILFDEQDAMDSVLKRLVAGIHQRLCQNDAAIVEALERATVMFEAWKRRDAGRVLQFLSEECIAQARRGEDVDDEMLRQMETIGGRAAREDTERRCRRFQRVPVAELPQRVEEIAEQARWDVLRERVEEGDVEGTLFPLLRDVQRGIVTLLSAAPQTSAQFLERFDVDFMLERHRNGSLSRTDVGDYATFLATTIGRMQAPADDEIVRPWVASVTSSAQNSSISMAEYLPSLVPVLRDAGTHILRIVDRLHQLRQAME